MSADLTLVETRADSLRCEQPVTILLQKWHSAVSGLLADRSICLDEDTDVTLYLTNVESHDLTPSAGKVTRMTEGQITLARDHPVYTWG